MNRVVVVLFIQIMASQLFAQDPLKKAIVLKAAPLFDEPVAGTLPQSFAEKGDSCVVDSFFTDSSGLSWFRLATKGHRRWAQDLSVSYITPENAAVQSLVLKDEADAKRRARVLHTHPEWPRRIRAAVREGRVCLGMTKDQLIASWDTPVQKGLSFILGIGECETWFFRSLDNKLLFVTLSNGEVSGWYEKDK